MQEAQAEGPQPPAGRNLRSASRRERPPTPPRGNTNNVDDFLVEEGANGGAIPDPIVANGGGVADPDAIAARGHDFMMKAGQVTIRTLEFQEVTLEGLCSKDMLVIQKAKPQIVFVGMFDRRYTIPPPVQYKGNNWMVKVAMVHSLISVGLEQPEVIEIQFPSKEDAVSFIEKVKNMPY